MPVETLVCPCGMRLKLPNAVPGRVGKCPRCGSMFRVPEPAPPIEKPAADPLARAGSFIRLRARSSHEPRHTRHGSDGLVTPPTSPEVRLRDSLLYPLWNASGLAVLSFMPVGLWFATVPIFGVVPIMRIGATTSVLGLIALLPMLVLLLFAGGNTLRFLGQVLITSSLGELTQPRSPSWHPFELIGDLGPWFWAFLIGACVGGMPAIVYWIYCGDVDWFDRVVLLDLLIPGLAYAQMALLASLLFETPLAANPVTIIRAIGRVGWAYLTPCLWSGSAIVLLLGLLDLVMQVRDGLGQSLAYWGFWVVTLYVAMVVLRWLGLFCYRHAVVLEWFPDRSRKRR